MLSQSARLGLSRPPPIALRRALEGGIRQMQLAGNADLHALEKRIVVLEQENSELWQEVHRLFFLIVAEARADKKALKTFSLVSRSWMHIAREILFARISLRSVKPFLNDPHCTIFPYVRGLFISRDDTNDGTSIPSAITPNWLDDYLVHVPKFTALTSLELYTLKARDLHNIAHALPPGTKQRIRQLTIYRPDASLSTITNFISNFTQLTTLKCGEMYESWRTNALARLLPSTQAGTNELAAPPPSLATLLFWESGHLPANVLKWLTAHHPGAIELFCPSDLQPAHPAEFRDFILSILHERDAVQLLDPQYLTTLSELTCIVLNFYNATLSWLPNIDNIYVEARDLARIDESAATGWPELDRTLAGGTAFPSLCSLTIGIRNSDKDKENLHEQEILRRLLPLSAEKRILDLKCNLP
ncbi:hypothetical protein B0H14DRAFT_3055369 [Mycena olivaceomarginata]|nr:hypothetical protein B0H14DRAFT_3055369 [Mycena olivaceomarginata]